MGRVTTSSTSLVVILDQSQDHCKTFRTYFQRMHSVKERPNKEYQFEIVGTKTRREHEESFESFDFTIPVRNVRFGIPSIGRLKIDTQFLSEERRIYSAICQR
jgi:hypothetical protein